ncbi:ATP-dependent DNA helicase [Trichonephila clavipes]|nr:ATP-dependent DNA helicase [Trichonephila clavipes]
MDGIDWENDPFDNDEDCPNPAPVETVIQGDVSTQMGLAIAPGENKLPISFVFDDVGEELSYPKIYCGELRHFTLEQNLPPMLK